MRCALLLRVVGGAYATFLLPRLSWTRIITVVRDVTHFADRITTVLLEVTPWVAGIMSAVLGVVAFGAGIVTFLLRITAFVDPNHHRRDP